MVDVIPVKRPSQSLEKAVSQSMLTPEETKVYDKCRYIQSFILTALEGGSLEINWKKLLEDGKFSEHSSKLFAKELSDAPNILS